GGAIALTSVSAKDVEVVGFLQYGDSNLPPLYMRAFLTSGFTGLRVVDQVEGVGIFQQYDDWRIGIAPPGGPAPAPREPQPYGPAMAMANGMLVVGSTPAGVKEVILRARGRAPTPSLASLNAYKDSAALRTRPGLYGYVNVEALVDQLDAAFRPGGPGASG